MEPSIENETGPATTLSPNNFILSIRYYYYVLLCHYLRTLGKPLSPFRFLDSSGDDRGAAHDPFMQQISYPTLSD